MERCLRFRHFFFSLLCSGFAWISLAAPLPDMASVTATRTSSPPEWVSVELELIRSIQAMIPEYMEKFTREDGTLYGGGPYDDEFEMFFNWPLFSAISGDPAILELAQKEYDALTLQQERPDNPDYYHQFYNEFPIHDDWFHLSEGMMFFYDFGVTDPLNEKNIERARRFAGLYLNEDPEAINFDFEHQLIPSIATGSKGCMDSRGGGYDIAYGHASLYPRITDPGVMDQEVFDEMVTRCDVPVNLTATALVTNAFLYTGEEKYKTWVLDYVDAWLQRIEDNDGILPDNIGRNGIIGEYRDGQWWGGLYGWSALYSLHMVFGALSVATECAHLLSNGDAKYLGLLRSQIDFILSNSRNNNGELQVPFRIGPGGWYDYRRPIIRDFAHLWHASMADEDWERIMRSKNASNYSWTNQPVFGDRTEGWAEPPRIAYFAGENPDWPQNAMRADLQEARNRLNRIRTDPRPASQINEDDIYHFNPIITKALTQVVLGAPQSIYNGGLLCARARYFDADAQVAGMPPDVAAFVENIAADLTVVSLANTSTSETRRVIVQAGAFAEHRFTTLEYQEYSGGNAADRSVEVNGRYVLVELPPSTWITLELGTERFAHTPTYAFPWHETLGVHDVDKSLARAPAVTVSRTGNSGVTITFSSKSSILQPEISATVYSACGRKAATLRPERIGVDTYRVTWDLSARNGRPAAPNGIYLFRIETPHGVWYQKAGIAR